MIRPRVDITSTAVLVSAPSPELARILGAVRDAHAIYGLPTPQVRGVSTERVIAECHPLLTGDLAASVLEDLLGACDLHGWPARVQHAVEGCGAVFDGATWRTSTVVWAPQVGWRAPTRNCPACQSTVSAGQLRAVMGN